MSTIQIIQTIISVTIIASTFVLVYRKSARTAGGNKIGFEVKDVNYDLAGNFGFDNIAGNIEAKEQVEDVVDFIKSPYKYTSYGARMPRGLIFYGQPGTGKTLMAKAIAGEAGVPFYSVSGSDFVHMYVGVGASRVRELFKRARKHGKAVIFIDEIDTIGKIRKGSGSGSADEKDQTLNALLTEMSGFNDNDGIVVIAATNRLDVLDPALLRPGRFDRHIEIGLPDLPAREKILKLHMKNKPISDTIDIVKLAQQTIYFTGAMLENLMNEAAIFSAKRGAGVIESIDVDRAFYTIVAGSEKQDRSTISSNDLQVSAYHEAGHALVTKLIAPSNIVSKVTIIPSTKGAGGFSMNIPKDQMFYTREDMEGQIKISLAGRAAEEVIFGPNKITTGASNDIERATQIAKDYCVRYGMDDELGMINLEVLLGNNDKLTYSEILLNQSSKLLKRLYDETIELIKLNRKKLVEISKELLIKETLEEDEINFIINE